MTGINITIKRIKILFKQYKMLLIRIKYRFIDM
jgi:hypothetical protein